MLGSLRQNRQNHIRPINQFPMLYRKIECPICLEYYTSDTKIPKIICSSKHTICVRCLNGIAIKGVETEQLPSCPLCRGQIKVPMPTNHELYELCCYMNMMDLKNDQLKKKVTECDLIMFKRQRDIKQKDKQIEELKKKLSSLEGAIQILNLELRQSKCRQEKQTICEKSEDSSSSGSIEKREKLFDVNQNKKAPLRWFCEDMVDDQHLSLAKKEYTKTQIQFMIYYDMTKLIDLNLSFNSIGNEGFQILCDQADMPNLQVLKICNNQINKLPKMKAIRHLRELDLSNYDMPPKSAANIFSQESFIELLDLKWEKLKALGMEFNTQQMWDKDEVLEKFSTQLPIITKMFISQLVHKITKAKCKAVSASLNTKAKRANNNKIKVMNSN